MPLRAIETPPAPGPVLEAIAAAEASVGGGRVRRLLPRRARRMVGPWCFADHFGPFDGVMDVGVHPHVGLQTVTWLLEGCAEHRDGLGTIQRIEPGQLNWMSAGRGLAHDEVSPDGPTRIHGVQLWVALPDAVRDGPPSFEHHAALPLVTRGRATVTVLAGALFGVSSPTHTPAPMVGAELRFDGAAALELPLEPGFEHALFAVEGSFELEHTTFPTDTLVYLGTRRPRLWVRTEGPARLMLLGGAPFGEPVLMWWNFVARRPEEIQAARADWTSGRRFSALPNHGGRRIPAPALPAG